MITEIDQFLVPMASINRMVAEYRKYGSLVIGYDFDGTVHDFHQTGTKHDIVIQLLRDLKSIGCRLVCWTAHPDPDIYVPQYLTENNIPFDSINEGGIKLKWESKKPFFSALLDDRAGLSQVYKELTVLIDIIKQERNASLRSTPVNL